MGDGWVKNKEQKKIVKIIDDGRYDLNIGVHVCDMGICS